jgi:hypothetical protein
MVGRIAAGTVARDPESQMPRNHPVQDRLEQRAMQLQEEAGTLPAGGERNALLHRAHKMESAARTIDGWLSSPGLRLPR